MKGVKPEQLTLPCTDNYGDNLLWPWKKREMHIRGSFQEQSNTLLNFLYFQHSLWSFGAIFVFGLHAVPDSSPAPVVLSSFTGYRHLVSIPTAKTKTVGPFINALLYHGFRPSSLEPRLDGNIMWTSSRPLLMVCHEETKWDQHN